MARKPKIKKKTYIAIQKIKSDIADNIIVAKKGEEIELTENEAKILHYFIKEKE